MNRLKQLLHVAEHNRAYFYRVAGAVGVVLTADGVVTSGTWAKIALVLGAVLGIGGNGLATVNTSTKRPPS